MDTPTNFARFVNLLKKIDSRLTSFEEMAVAALLFVMTFIIFFAVMERFFLQLGITWLEEVARYLSVWAAFLGSALAAKKGAHIGIEAFVQILPTRVRKIEELLVDLVGIAFSLVVLFVGLGFLSKLIDTNQLSPALRINVAWAYSAVPIGCGLMGLHYFIKFVVGLSEVYSPAQDGEAV